jgi:guanine deaminase
MASTFGLHGTIIHSLSPSEVEYLTDTLILTSEHQKIIALESALPAAQVAGYLSKHYPDQATSPIRYLKRGEFIIPGFVDTHNHAPQWAQRGLGRGLQILDWLEKVTFANEAKFADPKYARRIYSSCVDGFIKQGVTTASYYGSLHCEATKILADVCLEKGQRALVGKCNMNRNGASFYQDESAETSLKETRDVVEHIASVDPRGELIAPVLTPRFAICCDEELLTGLGHIVQEKPDIAIQTHFNEAKSEISATLGLFPQFENEADLYHHFNLLTPHSILAHCCHMEEYEIGKLKEYGCGVAHCPVSNVTVGGGFMAAPIRRFLEEGIKVGLGTDSGGGFSASILDAMRQAFIVSNARELMTEGAEKSLTAAECFYMATLGGAKVCSLDSKVGNFQVGKEFDALLVNVADEELNGATTMIEEEDELETIFEKFLMTGDDRNIVNVWIRGRLVKGVV